MAHYPQTANEKAREIRHYSRDESGMSVSLNYAFFPAKDFMYASMAFYPNIILSQSKHCMRHQDILPTANWDVARLHLQHR